MDKEEKKELCDEDRTLFTVLLVKEGRRKK
jgi:hypothetical protein